MTANARKRRDENRPSRLESAYLELFQQTTPDGTIPDVRIDFSQKQQPGTRTVIRNYTTYGAYEDPIALD